ncbi:MAG: FprA family A-type flavoprotein [Clostridia bacterium]
MLSKNIINVGLTSYDQKLFENQYPTNNGMAYNSYLIIDEKIALLDTIEIGSTQKWLENINKSLNGKTIDYLIISHMEPDHSASIQILIEKFPNIQIVASARAFTLLKQFYGIDNIRNKREVVDGDSLSLGEHNLTFYTAPMVHWPEVIVSYEDNEKVLFSADAFGKFGDNKTTDNWADEARRYYFNIVGKYGAQVQSLFNKIDGLQINTICSLHGPILDKDISKCMKLYNTWSKYEAENEGVLIAYASIYGNTEKVALEVANKLQTKSIDTTIIDLTSNDVSIAVSEAFRNSKLIVACPTYDGGLYPAMAKFLDHLTIKGYQNRKVGFIENGSWAPQSARKMRAFFENMKNITLCENIVSLRSAKNKSNESQIIALVTEIME